MNVPSWLATLQFEEIDARQLEGFFLQKIIQTAQSLEEGKGLKIIQSFEPMPLYGVMEREGWEHFTQKIAEDEFHIYFHRLSAQEEENEPVEEISAPFVHGTQKVPVVIQSATPVVYPIILRMLESPEIQKHFDVRELKVWEETEKHLGWIVSGKADISFSAIIASANLLNRDNDVKLATVSVWDNFYMVTRGYRASSFADLKDKKIHMPLFQKAPPAQVTRYIMRQFGYDPEQFDFTYGEPFGRPEEIAAQLMEGTIDTALIREPEVSYALNAHPDIQVAFSYSELWQQIKPQSHGLPNAGLLFKGAFLREHPDLAELFIRELDEAITWIHQNPDVAAEKSFEAMAHPYEAVRLFIDRAKFENIPAIQVKEEIQDYLSLLGDKAMAKMADRIDEFFVEKEFFDLQPA